MSARAPITFVPAGVTVWVATGSTVLDAARQAGVVLAAPCGGRGVCGACGVRVLAGALEAPDAEEARGLQRARPGMRLACRARVASAVTVRPMAVAEEHRQAAPGIAAPCRPLVAGVDLGTTSIACALIDSETGLEVARTSVANRQQTVGADVVSRMAAAAGGAAGELQRLAQASVRAAVEAAAQQAGCDSAGVERAVIAGNSVMAALLTGADIASLATHPFEPPAMPEVLSSDVSSAIGLGAATSVRLVPAIAGFVGGDALAAVVSAGMLDAESPLLLVDFGTNAEIVLAGAGSSRLIATSAAAGPAFEGIGISCGGPAAPGAVTRVRIGRDGSVSLDVIGDAQPAWFSGSGLVSLVGELRRSGHIDASGLLHEEGPLADRFERDVSGVLGVSVGPSAEDRLVLTQLDVRAVQLAKAAVRAGIDRVLAAGGIDAADLERVFVAGAFGSALEAGDLLELGVLPQRLTCPVTQVGNAALDGAALMALDESIMPLAREAAVDPQHVELALDPEFNRALVAFTELAPS